MAEVIVALDLPTVDASLSLVDRLPGLRWAKVGPMLFIADGPRLVRELKARGVQVFLDMKWHDIPHAVEGAVRAAARTGINLATVHALGGEDMLREGANTNTNGGRRPAAVPVLTSPTPTGYAAATGLGAGVALDREVRRLATVAHGAGITGVVCSAHEIPVARDVLGPDGWVVVPGIRPQGSAVGDQKRVADPASAARAGATHLVVGRPVTGASDPAGVYASLVAEGA